MEALEVITDTKRGNFDDLPNLLYEKVSGIHSLEEAELLIRVLGILGFIGFGIVKEGDSYKATWHATDKAYKEIYPWWKYLIKKLLGFI
jgi:hypothetical protein